ncbi:DJ-1/PfpI family protein [Roseospirillum parvum]|uniref:DJ-1/PfpI family protein n=1 Tax=Roseospirillum parvum TaxID=83401 RepID=A0A1G8FEZ7_9PROT|nr:DJ-1/PfpI family protein [Roseospirillum parvum]SDH80717.1 DJ-1/PfpI family protein [Roseospirillum parvum]
MDIALLLFPGVTPLDAIGPFEILGRLPGARIRTVAHQPGPMRTQGGSLALLADHALADISHADLLLVPGGPGADAAAADPQITQWVARLHQTTQWTTSVCTGALILGGAGLLDGVPATTHWRAMDNLAHMGALPRTARMVEHGRIITAAGVSAGLDMALELAQRLAGREIAEAIQLALEYTPQPPLNAGDITTAPEDRIHRARHNLNRP